MWRQSLRGDAATFGVMMSCSSYCSGGLSFNRHHNHHRHSRTHSPFPPSSLFMLSIVNALSRWVLGSEESDFLRTCSTGLGRIPHPIFLEALSRSLQRGYKLKPIGSSGKPEYDHDSDSDSQSSHHDAVDDDDIPPSSSRPGIPYELVVIVFRYAGFHRPRSEDLIPFKDERHDVWSRGPLAMEDVAVSEPLTDANLKTLCALRISELSSLPVNRVTYSSDPRLGLFLSTVTNS